MVIQIDRHKIWHYILIYFIIIEQGSVIFNIYQDYFSILFVIIAGVYFLQHRDEVFCINMEIIYLLAFYLIFLFVWTGGSLSVFSIGSIISRFLIAYVAYNYDRENFIDRYVKAVTFFAAISLIIFVGQLLAYDTVINLLPKHTVGNYTYYGGILGTVVPSHSTRNVGLATEPGRYQIYLSVAIYFCFFRNEMIFIKEKWKPLVTVILLAAILTAQSTTGYIALIILLVGYFINRRAYDVTTEDELHTRKLITGILVVAVLMAILLLNNTGTDNFIYRNFISKIFGSGGTVDLSSNTGGARVNSMLTDMKLALSHPLGMGFEDYESEWLVNRVNGFTELSSCVGFTRSCATIGFIGTALILWFYIRNALKNSKNWLDVIIMLALLLNTSLGQPSLYFTSFIVMFLAGGNKALTENYEAYTEGDY